MNNNARYADALDNDEPIEFEGLTLYPIKMRYWREFEAAKNAILLRQSSLPVKYAVLSYLGALFALDFDAFNETGTAPGFIAGAVTMLGLAMRYPVKALLDSLEFEVSEKDEHQLVSLRFQTGEYRGRITPKQFDTLRWILAAQNGLELPDESENIDLVEAEMDIAAKGAEEIVPDFRALLASVARDQRCRPSELMDYTIREFNDLRAAIERDKMFTIAKTAEFAGTTFSKGNPWPSWCYDRKGRSNSMIPMSEFMAGPGSVATMK